MLIEGKDIYVSATEVNAYLECPAKFAFNSVPSERVKAPNKLALAGGQAIHSALKLNYSQKTKSREDLPLENVIDYFSEQFDKEIVSVDPDDFKIEKAGDVKDSWVDTLKKYHTEVAPRIFPVDVEQRIKVKLKDYPIGLTGQSDVFDEDQVLIDHKTTSRPYKSVPNNYQLQVGGCYPILRASLNSVDPTALPPKEARIDYLVRRSPDSPNIEIRHIPITIDTDYFLNVFKNVSKGISAGVFPPNRGHMYCSRRFCKFWEVCELKNGGRVRE